MADSDIDGLTAVTTVAGTTRLEVSELGTSKMVTVKQLADYIDPILVDTFPAQAITAATDTYITGSAITIPQSRVQVGTRWRIALEMSKTAASTATPVVNIRYGTAGTVADSSKTASTLGAQTAVAGSAYWEWWGVFTAVGASAVMKITRRLVHDPGFGAAGQSTFVTTATFDSSPAGSKVGISINTGTSAVWTVNMVETELWNLA